MDNEPDKEFKSEEEYKLLMNSLGVSVSKHLLDDHFTLVWANDIYYKLIGYPKPEYEALFRNQCDRYFADNKESWESIVKQVTEAVEKGQNHFTEYCRMGVKGGGMIWVKMVGTFTDEYVGGSRVSYTVMTDVTEMMQMRIERSVTYDNVPGFIAKYRIGKKEVHLLEGNEKLISFFGLDKNDLWSYKAFSSIADASKPLVQKQISRMRRGLPVQFLTQVTNRHGAIAWMQAHGECVGQIDGDSVYLIVYIDITDITEQRALHKELEESAEKLRLALAGAEQANRAKSDFMARMSHDLRTPMNAIVGMTAIAANNIENREKVTDCLKKIDVSGKHLLGLINDVLDMSKIESGELALSPAPLFLPDFLANVYTIVQQMVSEKGLDYSVRLKNVEHEEIVADELRLRQVFINIISNACKFTPAGGKISVKIEEIPHAQEGRSVYRFIFADSGIGIKPDFIGQVFDVFARERDSRTDRIEGSGLGMAITKRIVELLGGDIAVESTVGEGTTFTVVMPFATAEISCMRKNSVSFRVLLLNDVSSFHTAMKTVEELGMSVDCVESADEALLLCEKNAYDLIILDFKKLGDDAENIVGKIKSFQCEDTVVAAASYDRSEIERAAETLGISAHVSKPVFASTVCNAVQKYLIRADKDIYVKPAVSYDFSGKRFLIVEDNELNREIAEELLREENAAVDSAVNGAAGLAMFESSPVGYYDLILMDVQMPVMNGYEATWRIRELPRADAKKVPILAMTADAFAEDIAKSCSVGMDGHLSKPLNVTAMYRTINGLLARAKK